MFICLGIPLDVTLCTCAPELIDVDEQMFTLASIKLSLDAKNGFSEPFRETTIPRGITGRIRGYLLCLHLALWSLPARMLLTAASHSYNTYTFQDRRDHLLAPTRLFLYISVNPCTY